MFPFLSFRAAVQPEHPEIHHEEERWSTRLQRHQEEPAVRRGERRVSWKTYLETLVFELVFNDDHKLWVDHHLLVRCFYPGDFVLCQCL